MKLNKLPNNKILNNNLINLKKKNSKFLYDYKKYMFVIDNYNIISVLNQNSISTIYLTNRENSLFPQTKSTLFSLKVIKLSLLDKDKLDTYIYRIEISKLINHKYILDIRDAFLFNINNKTIVKYLLQDDNNNNNILKTIKDPSFQSSKFNS